MNELKDKTQSIKKRKLIVWGIRQVITACIVIPVVIKWPHLKWLIPVWIVIGTASLVIMLLMFRKLQDKLTQLDSMLKKANEDNDAS